jgi:hypothetical protein
MMVGKNATVTYHIPDDWEVIAPDNFDGFGKTIKAFSANKGEFFAISKMVSGDHYLDATLEIYNSGKADSLEDLALTFEGSRRVLSKNGDLVALVREGRDGDSITTEYWFNNPNAMDSENVRYAVFTTSAFPLYEHFYALYNTIIEIALTDAGGHVTPRLLRGRRVASR